MASRLSRRRFAPLTLAPTRQGPAGEFYRLVLRALGLGDERLAYQANDWLMRTMAGEVERNAVRAVHSYEDCSLWQFEMAKRKGVACIYDMPIAYYPVWLGIEKQLVQKYADWLPSSGAPFSSFVRPKQKDQELALADLILVPSAFVDKTIRDYFPNKQIKRVAYGVNSEFWSPGMDKSISRPLTFIYAGQSSLRKGTPDLLLAWKHAALKDARLRLVGSWHLSAHQLRDLPGNVEWCPPCSAEQLRDYYRDADVFLFPSHFEGFGLVLLEAMACGLPALASDATAMPDLFSGAEGQVFPSGNVDALVAALQWASACRDLLPEMGENARKRAELCTWTKYRQQLRDAVAPILQ